MTNRVSFEKLGEKCKITIANESESNTCTTTYSIRVFDSLDNKWESHVKATTICKPNNTYSHEYHKYGATDWELYIEESYCE